MAYTNRKAHRTPVNDFVKGRRERVNKPALAWLTLKHNKITLNN